MERKDYSGAIHWQLVHGVRPDVIANLFKRSRNSIEVIAWRDKNKHIPKKVAKILSETRTAGTSAETLLHDAKVDECIVQAPVRVSDLESEIDSFARNFWTKVQDHRGARELGLLLRRVSRPSLENLPLRQSAARLYHLLAEVYLHAGCCHSSLVFGLKAYRAEERLYKETLGRYELFMIGKTCLLVSQALINRSDFEAALPWIKRAKQAFVAGSYQVDPEHHKQLATVQFHTNALNEAKENYKLAGSLLPTYKHGLEATVAQVRDISERPLNLLRADWEEAFGLAEFALKNYSGHDIHKALNVNWAAAAGLMTDSPESNIRALALLRVHKGLTKGYLHPETVTELLEMTPNLPKGTRPDWVKFSLHYNACRNL